MHSRQLTSVIIWQLLLLAFAAPMSAEGSEGSALAVKMYSSRRAASRGDLIRVIVDEQTSASKEHSIQTGKEFSTSAAEGVIGNPNSQYSLPRSANFALPPYNLSGSADFSGDGNTSSAESLAASLTAQVADVLPNDVLLIHGERLVTIGEEEVRMILTGLVRQRDVTAGNTVHSSEIADARIRYVSTGEVSRGASPGWLSRILSFLNPF